MKLQDKKKIADEADMIINGYAFTKKDDKVFVVHLESFHHVAVIFHDIIIETNMDEIECQIVLDYYHKNKEFLEKNIAASSPKETYALFKIS